MDKSNSHGKEILTRPRRSHKKSRRGCLVCKGRHTKCDETRPACLNCTITGRQCTYVTATPSAPVAAAAAAAAQSHVSTPLSNACEPSSTATTPSTLTSNSPEHAAGDSTTSEPIPEDPDIYTIDHMILFRHAITHMSSILTSGPACNSAIQATVEVALKSAPYLMNELLAIAALHLSHENPTRPEYRQQATALQTRALSSFNRAKENITETTCIPMFLFSSLMGLHVLHDTIQNRTNSFSSFLDSFVRYLSLHRGVAAVTGRSWATISNSHLRPFIEKVESVHEDNYDSAEEDQVLFEMIKAPGLSPSSINTYHATIHALQQSFALFHRLKANGLEPYDGPLSFCVKLEQEYIEHIEQQRPEALVILAFYGVLLHWSRDFWVFQDGGQFLIQSIIDHLGSYWARWLTWPSSVLQQDTDMRHE